MYAELILTGHMWATPGRHRLRVEMIRVEDGVPLWVEDVIAQREQMVELAGELVNRVTSRLRAGETPIEIDAEAAPAVQRATSPASREAHDLYLRAHHEWQNLEQPRDAECHGPATACARAGLRLDGGTRGACATCHPAMHLRLPVSENRGRYRAPGGGSNSGIECAVRSHVAGAGLGGIHFDRDARSAMPMMARSAGLRPDAMNTRVRSWLLLSRHRFGEAVELLRAAIQLDPYAPWLQAALAWSLHLAGERDASVTQILKAIDMSAEYDKSLFFGAMILGFNGEAARAVALAETLAARSSHYDLALSAHAYALACAGQVEESLSLLERLQWLSRERYVLNTLNAATHVVLGEFDEALEELRTANESRCPWFFHMLADPRLKPLKGRPEFAALEASLKAMETAATPP